MREANFSIVWQKQHHDLIALSTAGASVRRDWPETDDRAEPHLVLQICKDLSEM